MRVIAGKYKGRRLKTMSGGTTRPTTDKVKESVFNMIGPFFDGGNVLDLYAGSGSLAIESVSRGCDFAICVDRSFSAIKIIQENIEWTKDPLKFKLMKAEAKKALTVIAEQTLKFDYIFLDPPYADQEITTIFKLLTDKKLFSENCIIVCEVAKEVDLPDNMAGCHIWKKQVYGITKVVIYKKEEHDET